ncbi:hypothetical protein KGQ20_29305 [Catenulispora sp. NF23]|nr:hypothetical protein [Catenulispora pinistramenti]
MSTRSGTSRTPPREEAREQRIANEIVVDAYGPEEQAMSWYYYLQDHLVFPFIATCRIRRQASPYRSATKSTSSRWRMRTNASMRCTSRSAGATGPRTASPCRWPSSTSSTLRTRPPWRQWRTGTTGSSGTSSEQFSRAAARRASGASIVLLTRHGRRGDHKEHGRLGLGRPRRATDPAGCGAGAQRHTRRRDRGASPATARRRVSTLVVVQQLSGACRCRAVCR